MPVHVEFKDRVCNISDLFPKGSLVNFDAQWLLEHTDLLEDSFPAQCVVGAVSADAPLYTDGALPTGGAALTNCGLYRNARVAGTGQAVIHANADAAPHVPVLPAQITNQRGRKHVQQTHPARASRRDLPRSCYTRPSNGWKSHAAR